MKEIKQTCYKGTRILLGNEKRDMLNNMITFLKSEGFVEIQIPIIQFSEIFSNKVGEENNNLMFNFTDRANRQLCLAPEYTAIVQELSKTFFKQTKDMKIFYVAECFRGEKPQAGRYRQFTQLGVEILNPSKDYNEYLQDIAFKMIRDYSKADLNDLLLFTNTTRGLDYYKDGKGFEITCNSLGSSKQICGGGEYDGGIGFAIGIDRVLLANEETQGEVKKANELSFEELKSIIEGKSEDYKYVRRELLSSTVKIVIKDKDEKETSVLVSPRMYSILYPSPIILDFNTL